MCNKKDIMDRVNQLLQLITDLKDQVGKEDIRPEIKERNKHIHRSYREELVRLLNKLN